MQAIMQQARVTVHTQTHETESVLDCATLVFTLFHRRSPPVEICFTSSHCFS